MSEADWWLCPACNSLNNLAARKCYSCRRRKPRDAVRASEYLNYRPVVSWDGKVRLEQLTAEEQEASAVTSPLPHAAPLPPPLRDPVPRDTLAVAPRPPHPATITYRLGEPASVPPPAGPWPASVAPPPQPGAPAVGGAPEPAVSSAPGPPVAPRPAVGGTPAPAVGGAPGPPVAPRPAVGGAPAPPVGHGPAVGGAPGPAVSGAPEPPVVSRPAVGGTPAPPVGHGPVVGGAPEPPVVPVGPGVDATSRPPDEPWPHWQELLDGPVPHADRLRTSASADAASEMRARAGSRQDGLTLRSAIRLARTGEADEFVPWPEADRQPPEAGGVAGGNTEWPEEDRRTED